MVLFIMMMRRNRKRIGSRHLRTKLTDDRIALTEEQRGIQESANRTRNYGQFIPS